MRPVGGASLLVYLLLLAVAAYVDALRDDKVRAKLGAERLRYVFTKEAGAIESLQFLADTYDRHIGATPRRTSTSFGFASSNVGTWTRLDGTGSTPTIIRRRTHRRGSRLSSSGSWGA